MADYVLMRKSRNALSSALHLIFNVLLGVGSVLVTIVTSSWIPGVVLVCLSKWRTFAVRPRYLWVNIKASLVDFIVGVSFVIMTYCSGTSIMPIHYILAALYTLWLVILKPRSSSFATELQSMVAVILGTTAAVFMTANANSVFLVVLNFIIGYSAARHVLIQATDDSDYELIPFAGGLLSAEIAWLCHSWLIIYQFNSVGIMVPQLTVIMAISAFIFGFAYKQIKKHEGKLRARDVAMPLAWGILVVAIIILWFSVPKFNV
jgi:hypothetical protein